MTDEEILQEWKRGYSKFKVAETYKRQYNHQISIIRSELRNRHSGRYITNYEALAYTERVIYKYLKER